MLDKCFALCYTAFNMMDDKNNAKGDKRDGQ